MTAATLSAPLRRPCARRTGREDGAHGASDCPTSARIRAPRCGLLCAPRSGGCGARSGRAGRAARRRAAQPVRTFDSRSPSVTRLAPRAPRTARARSCPDAGDRQRGELRARAVRAVDACFGLEARVCVTRNLRRETSPVTRRSERETPRPSHTFTQVLGRGRAAACAARAGDGTPRCWCCSDVRATSRLIYSHISSDDRVAAYGSLRYEFASRALWKTRS